MHSCTIKCGFSIVFIGCGKFSQKSPKKWQGYRKNTRFIWPLHCMVAPIFHNKCSKNQPKGILDEFLHHPMWCSTHFPALHLVLNQVAHQVPSQVRFLVVCLVFGQVLHPVVFPGRPPSGCVFFSLTPSLSPSSSPSLTPGGCVKFPQKWARA